MKPAPVVKSQLLVRASPTRRPIATALCSGPVLSLWPHKATLLTPDFMLTRC